jgi:hypothetical protein
VIGEALKQLFGCIAKVSGKSNGELFAAAHFALQVLFYDTSVSKEKARENLESLRTEAARLIESLKDEPDL